MGSSRQSDRSSRPLNTYSVSLNGSWQLAFGPQTDTGPDKPADLPKTGWPAIAATVPGNVELDMLAAGLIKEPSRGNNIYALRHFETFEWWYNRLFQTPQARADQPIELVFDGLDCFATIWLNGTLLGRTDNMLIPHRFDVTGKLRPGGQNDLFVRIASPILEGRRHHPAPGEFASRMNWESLNVRKAPHMYGWDIMPRLVSAGLWRGVHLDILEPTRWRDVYWTTIATDASQRTAQVLVDWDFVTERRDADGMRVRISIERNGRVVHRSEALALGTPGRARLDLQDVDLWWPRGYATGLVTSSSAEADTRNDGGASDADDARAKNIPARDNGGANAPAALYDACVELLAADGRLLATDRDRIGLRTVELRRTDVTTAEQPGEFVFVVNGEKIFIKGTNWVPLDALHSRDPRHLHAACAMLADLNCNMVRCWGGNVYEDHPFFDFCDEHGLLVWQDFALACALYPQTDDFAAKLRIEAEAVVSRLRNHPSLALWAGNNEIDECFSWTGLGLDPNTDRLSRQVLPDVVRRLDPLRPYLPSSPYRSPELVRRGNQMELEPEQHLWGPRDDFKGPFYTSSLAHFVSEIGYHGCTDRRSIEEFLDKGSAWPWWNNDQWLTHATRPHPAENCYDYRIPLMAKQVAVLFDRVPEELNDYILASQISQAEALKFFIELWRGGKWRRTGMLWWNLRDGWPIFSDAVVDYYGRKKLAYEYIRRVQTDVCVFCGEADAPTSASASGTTDATPKRRPTRMLKPGLHPLIVVNDTLVPVAGKVAVKDADTGDPLFAEDFTVERNGKAVLGSIPAPTKPAMWLLDWTLDGGTPRHNHYLAGPRPFSLAQYKNWLKKLGLAILDFGF